MNTYPVEDALPWNIKHKEPEKQLNAEQFHNLKQIGQTGLEPRIGHDSKFRTTYLTLIFDFLTSYRTYRNQFIRWMSGVSLSDVRRIGTWLKSHIDGQTHIQTDTTFYRAAAEAKID